MISRNAILCLCLFFISCRGNEKKIRYSDYDNLSGREEISSASNENLERASVQGEADSLDKLSYYDLTDDSLDNKVYYTDTVTVQTAEKLIKQIKSNRLIRLIDKEYILKASSYNQAIEGQQGLLIEGIKNLKIVGTGSSKLLVYERNATVFKCSNAYNIHLDNIIFGHREHPVDACEQSVLISHSYNVNISNCKLLGAGTFGLVTYDVYNLNFTNSEITACTCLIFELEKSRKFEFKNAKFHNNDLATSVLGAFTDSTKEITFLNCSFLDNKPKMVGNPAFNFMDNYSDFEEKILFENCTFKNNKGFTWYEEKIQLNNCKIDTSDFIDFPEKH